jgi:hypothetical protein
VLLLQTSGNQRAFHGQNAKYPELEQKLLEHVSKKQQYSCTVSMKMIQLIVSATVKELEINSF